jgi:PAS domain S-box-containing protein
MRDINRINNRKRKLIKPVPGAIGMSLTPSVNLYLKLLRINPVPLTISNFPACIVLEISGVFLDIIGCTRDEICGKKLADIGEIINPGENDSIVNVLRKRRTALRSRIDLYTKSGGKCGLSVCTEPLELNNDLFLLSFYETADNDISAKLRRRGHKSRFCDLADKLPLGALIIRDDKIIYANEHAAMIFALPPENILNSSLSEVLENVAAGRHREKAGLDLDRLLAGDKKISQSRLKINTRSRENRWIELLCQPTVYNDEPALQATIFEFKPQKRGVDRQRKASAFVRADRRRAGMLTGEPVDPEGVFDNPAALEEYRRIVADNTSNLIVIIQDSKIKFANKKVQELSGFTDEELRSRNFFEFVHRDEKQKVARYYDGWLKGLKIPRPISIRLLQKNGSYNWVKVTAASIVWKTRPAILVLFSNITEEKSAIDALKSEHDFVHLLLETANSLIICLDSQARITVFNNEIEKVTGYSREEVVGKRWPDIFLPENVRHDGLKNFAEWVIKHPKDMYEGPLITKAGEIRTVLWSNSAILCDDPEKMVAIAVGQDITERKAAELAVIESEKRFRELAELLPETLFESDLHGNLVFVNEAAYGTFGYTEDDFRNGLKTSQMVIPGDRGRMLENMHKILCGEKSHGNEYTALRKDGTTFPVIVYSNVVHRNASTAGLRGIIVDITSRKKAEEALAKRFRYEKGLADCSQALLQTGLDPADALTRAMKALLHASEVDRVYIFKNRDEPQDGLCMSQVYEVCAEDVEPQIDNPVLKNLPYKEVSDRLQNILASGGVFKGLVETFPENERKVLEPQNIVSILILPLWVDGEWYGFIGFDDTRIPRRWSDEDISLLRTAAEMIGAFTERENAGNALRKSESKYRLLIENADEIICSISSSGEILTMNNAAASYINGKPPDFIGKSLYDLFPGTRINDIMKKIKYVIDSGKKISGERSTDILGGEKWFLSNLQPIAGYDGMANSVLVIAKDITDEKLQELRVKSRSQLLESLRKAGKINQCLQAGCQAIFNAKLFKRAILTIHNRKREIIHYGQVGLEEETVKKAIKQPAPDEGLAGSLIRDEFCISKSYFVPAEAGLNAQGSGRYIAQTEENKSWNSSWKIGDDFFIPLLGADTKPEGWLSVDTPFNGRRPVLEDAQYLEEILDIVIKKVNEIKYLDMLQNERQALQAKNITLKEVLSSIEEEKMDIKRQLADDIENNLLPAMKKLVRDNGTVNRFYYNLVEDCLKNIASLSGNIHNIYDKLSPREMEICNLIRSGSSSKDIALLLNISTATVHKHREIIRKKFGLTNKNINLTTFLKNL